MKTSSTAVPSPFCRLRQISLWGDFGDVLISGFATRDNSTGQLRLHRGGPFVPPVSFPWDSTSGHALVVTEACRRELEQSPLGTLRFQPVIKHHIAQLPFAWEQWDRNLDTPPVRPPGGEPEAYLPDQPHSPALTAELPELWEVLPPNLACKIDQDDVSGRRFISGAIAEHRGLFRDRETWFDLIVDPPARQWLEHQVRDWVSFDPLFQR